MDGYSIANYHQSRFGRVKATFFEIGSFCFSLLSCASFLSFYHSFESQKSSCTYICCSSCFILRFRFFFFSLCFFFYFGFIWANDAPYYSCRCALVWYSCSNSVSVFGLSIFVRERNMLCTIYRLFICVTKLYNLNRSSWHRILLGWKHTLKALNCTREYEYQCELANVVRYRFFVHVANYNSSIITWVLFRIASDMPWYKKTNMYLVDQLLQCNNFRLLL